MLLNINLCSVITYAAINDTIYVGKPGNVVKTQSVDDETGLINTGLPNLIPQSTKSELANLMNSNISTNSVQSSGIIWENKGWYGSSYVDEFCSATGYSNLSQVFVKYLTSSWAKASSYTWSTANTVSWTYGGNATFDIADKVRTSLNLSQSRTTTYSVGITIQASSSKFSKLGFASDYYNQNYYYAKIVDNIIVATETGYIRTPKVDTYLIVYYQ